MSIAIGLDGGGSGGGISKGKYEALNNELISLIDRSVAGEYHVPDGVTKIGAGALYNAPLITKVVIPEGVTEIGESALGYMPMLREVVIPDSCTVIGKKALAGNTLPNFVFNRNIQTIELGAFNSCTFDDLVIPKHLKISGGTGGAFSSSTFNSLTFEEGYPALDYYALSSYCTIKQLNLASTIKSINYRSFWYTTCQKKIVMPKDLTTLYDGALERLQGTEILDFQDKLTYLGKYSLQTMIDIKTIILRSPIVVTNNIAFASVIPQSIYVPDDLVEQYKVATNWVQHADKIKPLSEYVEE